jgi:hypothetical protein
MTPSQIVMPNETIERAVPGSRLIVETNNGAKESVDLEIQDSAWMRYPFKRLQIRV